MKIEKELVAEEYLQQKEDHEEFNVLEIDKEAEMARKKLEAELKRTWELKAKHGSEFRCLSLCRRSQSQKRRLWSKIWQGS